MVDILVEGSDGLDEEIGFTLNEDTVIQTFPFSAVVPAALEARNKLLLQTENETGTKCLFVFIWRVEDLVSSAGHFITTVVCRRRCIHGVPRSREAIKAYVGYFCPSLLTLEGLPRCACLCKFYQQKYHFYFGFLGAHIIDYLVGVFTDLLHSQRDALALCLMFQLYDKDLQSLKVSKYPQLYQFNQYYNLWIPQQAQEPVVCYT